MRSMMMALALVLSLTVTSLAHAQSATATPLLPAPPKVALTVQPENGQTYMISGGQLAAIGIGAVAGTVLFHATMAHGLMLVGAVVGGWVGDWWYAARTAEQKSGG